MAEDRRAALQQLVEKWRCYEGSIGCIYFYQCAAELEAALLADGPVKELPVCGYCGTPLHVDGEILHAEDCQRPQPTEGDTDDD